jgi:hypothetical protein
MDIIVKVENNADSRAPIFVESREIPNSGIHHMGNRHPVTSTRRNVFI